MPNMRALALTALVPFALGQQYMLNLDCTNYPGPCNNDCYAAYVAGKSTTLNYNGPGNSPAQRAAAGCVSPSPCTNGKMNTPNSDETSCDEYPYASVVEGGTGAILRCTDLDENTAEGTDLSKVTQSECGNQPCTFMVTFGNPDGGQTPYCMDGGGSNDGFEYTYAGNGVYNPARRDSSTTATSDWVLHEPDPADYFPPHLRREFLLANGERTIISSRDLTASYDDAVFVYVRNGTVLRTYAVKELLGLEKSYALQDPALRDAKRAVQFAS